MTEKIEKKTRRKRRLPLKGKLFLSFAGFLAFLLAFLWVFQIVFLDDFYYFITKNSLERAGAEIAQADADDLQTVCDTAALQYNICVRVLNAELEDLASSEISAGSIIHRLGKTSVGDLYREAKEKKTVVSSFVFGFAPTGSEETENADAPAAEKKKGEPGRYFDMSRMVYAGLFSDGEGAERLILLDTALTPVGSVKNTLKIQLLLVSALAVLIALAGALILSHRLSKPIVGLSESAALLASGRYDATFRGGGCREIDELSGTLTYAEHELSKVDRMQKELIANISHDLRTPLTMISGYSEVMRDIPGENTPENMQVIIDETKRLTALVNDLIEVSRLQSGSRTPKPELFSLTEALKQTCGRFEKLTECKGYTIRLESDGEHRVLADRTGILQVLYNLIGNAISYTGEDKTVLVRERGEGAFVRVDVIDSGEGIPEEDLPRIWERYYKSGEHRRGVGGSGLGLSIVKGILEEHGAAYGVSSEPGKGSDFWFRLPEAGAAPDRTEGTE
ncbi:MAG: HAMP domain-containing histidine kinase [Clostridia bacterium]|nr:HAMP domain-containing histidine kinase [Clostridia bacterium]